MRVTLVIAVTLLLAVAAWARTQELSEAVSPNGRYTVRAVESGAPLRISYDIVSVRTGALLHRFPSSYQPDADGGNWDREHATQAEIWWSPDSRYVAIDEQVHQYIGEVLLAEVGEVTRSIRLPETTLIGRTKAVWTRFRIRVEDGWLSPRQLSLGIAGLVVSGEPAGGQRPYKNIRFHFVLRFDRGKATIVRLDAPEDG